jgi:hypothetical protein
LQRYFVQGHDQCAQPFVLDSSLATGTFGIEPRQLGDVLRQASAMR